MQVVMKENSKLVQLIGNSLDQLFGMSPLQLHRYVRCIAGGYCDDKSFLPVIRLLGSIDGTLVEALRGMLVGQCAILTLTQPKTATGSLTATSIQLVGDSCQTILSYPPFSINQPSHLADSPGTPLSASLSHFSESLPSEAIPLISPSPCVASTHTLPPPPPIVSSQHQYEATPELFPEWNQSCNSSPELLPASTSYSTPLPRRTHLSPRTLSDNLSTPEIL